MLKDQKNGLDGCLGQNTGIIPHSIELLGCHPFRLSMEGNPRLFCPMAVYGPKFDSGGDVKGKG